MRGAEHAKRKTAIAMMHAPTFKHRKRDTYGAETGEVHKASDSNCIVVLAYPHAPSEDAG